MAIATAGRRRIDPFDPEDMAAVVRVDIHQETSTLLAKREEGLTYDCDDRGDHDSSRHTRRRRGRGPDGTIRTVAMFRVPRMRTWWRPLWVVTEIDRTTGDYHQWCLERQRPAQKLYRNRISALAA